MLIILNDVRNRFIIHVSIISKQNFGIRISVSKKNIAVGVSNRYRTSSRLVPELLLPFWFVDPHADSVWGACWRVDAER